MTTALIWVRNNAKQFDQYTLDVDGVAYVATWFIFKGRVPNHMVPALKAELPNLVVTDTEIEVLRIGGQYRSDYNKCVFTRTIYEKAA